MMDKEGLTLREIQLSMLDILKWFHDFCEENNLTYYLAYGTLIGAIRHKGFIPWDDDVDIWMLREDFERLKEIFAQKDYKIDSFKLCMRSNTERYEYYIPRISDTRYQFISTASKKQIGDMGTFIDIYPLDTYEENNEVIEQTYQKINKVNDLYRFYADFRASASMLNTILKAPLYVVLHLIYGKNYSKKVDDKVDAMITKVTTQNGKCCGLLGWRLNNRRAYSTEKLKERILVEFEDTKLWAPKEYDYILSDTYGDYMALPPESARQPYHQYVIVKK